MKPPLVISYDSFIPAEFFDDLVNDAAESEFVVNIESRNVGPVAGLEWLLATSVFVLLLKPFLDAFLKRAADDVANAAYPQMKSAITRLASKVLISTRETWVRITPSRRLPRAGRSSFFSIQAEINGSRTVRFVFNEGSDEATYAQCVSEAFRLLEAHYGKTAPDPFADVAVDEARKRIFMVYDDSLKQWRAIDLNTEVRRIANEARQLQEKGGDSN